MKKGRYHKTIWPKLWCPKCLTRLEITNLGQRLWCETCYEMKEKGISEKEYLERIRRRR